MRARLFRILLTFSNLTRPSIFRQPQRPASTATTLKSMPSIPFLSALFGSSASKTTMASSYPDERSPDEWRAVLNPGKSGPSLHLPFPSSN